MLFIKNQLHFILMTWKLDQTLFYEQTKPHILACDSDLRGHLRLDYIAGIYVVVGRAGFTVRLLKNYFHEILPPDARALF